MRECQYIYLLMSVNLFVKVIELMRQCQYTCVNVIKFIPECQRINV
jgi:hypothetical protein